MNLEIRDKDLDLKSYRKIGEIEYAISTVALTIEHHGGMWYETMIFPAKDGKISDYGELYGARYKTKEEAATGHKALVDAPDAEFQEALQ